MRSLSFALLSSALAAISLPPGTDDIVTFSGGSVVGQRVDGQNLRYWLAVPFAASTDGANAYAPPQQRQPWSGTLDCRSWGAGCLQSHHNPDAPANQSYDCLNVNVYAPILPQGAAPVSVMVFFHGGAYLEGSNQGPFGIYAGQVFASQHNVVLVAANYRLGPFGWAYTGAGGATGNYGLMDQIAALEWVKDNIAAVGGDPTSVTVFGESAGAMSTGILMTLSPTDPSLPSPQGLFTRAMMESNVAGFNYKNASEAAVFGATFCSLLNCSSPCTAACLRAQDPYTTMAAWNKATGDVGDFILTDLGHILDGLLGTGPVLDGVFMTREPMDAVQSGEYWAKGMPVLLGTNSNEGETFIYDGVSDALPGFLVPLAYLGLTGFNETAATLIDGQERYNSSAYPDGRTPLSHMVTDYWFRCASEQFLAAAARAGAPAFAYRYAHVYSNSSIFPTFGLPEICATSVCHASELPFVFGNVPSFTSFTPAEQALTASMTAFWAAFAKGGDPNGPSGSTAWPAWTAGTRMTLVLDETLATESTVGMCGFWDTVSQGYYF